MLKIPVLKTKSFQSEQIGTLEIDKAYANELCSLSIKRGETPRLGMAITKDADGNSEIVAVNIDFVDLE